MTWPRDRWEAYAEAEAEFAACPGLAEAGRALCRMLARPRADGHRGTSPGMGPSACPACARLEDDIRYCYHARWGDFVRACPHWRLADAKDARKGDVSGKLCPDCWGLVPTQSYGLPAETRPWEVQGDSKTSHAPAPAPAPITMAVIRAMVLTAGGSLSLPAGEWAQRLNLAIRSPVNPTLPGDRAVAFGRWRVNDYTTAEWAAAGLRWRRKIIHGRRLVEITALPVDAENIEDDLR